ncbi:MAG: hypothetical protein ACLR3M_09010 [Collinsella sp.]
MSAYAARRPAAGEPSRRLPLPENQKLILHAQLRHGTLAKNSAGWGDRDLS